MKWKLHSFKCIKGEWHLVFSIKPGVKWEKMRLILHRNVLHLRETTFRITTNYSGTTDLVMTMRDGEVVSITRATPENHPAKAKKARPIT